LSAFGSPFLASCLFLALFYSFFPCLAGTLSFSLLAIRSLRLSFFFFKSWSLCFLFQFPPEFFLNHSRRWKFPVWPPLGLWATRSFFLSQARRMPFRLFYLLPGRPLSTAATFAVPPSLLGWRTPFFQFVPDGLSILIFFRTLPRTLLIAFFAPRSFSFPRESSFLLV